MAEISFNEFARKTLLRQDRLIRAVGIATFNGVIRDSPVGDPDNWKKKPPVGSGYVGGRFRGNWRCSLAAPDLTTFEDSKGPKYDKNFPGLGAVLGDVSKSCQEADRKSVLWLANSLPYAYRLEYEGWSRQAPEGMVRRNVARVKQNISKELRKLKTS